MTKRLLRESRNEMMVTLDEDRTLEEERGREQVSDVKVVS